MRSKFILKRSNKWCIPYTSRLASHPEDCGEISKKIDVFLGGFMKRTRSCQRLQGVLEALE